MDAEMLRNHCISKQNVTEEFPFDDDALVFKVCGKMFCLISLGKPDSCLLKCDPEKAVELREEYEQIKPGYHMNKTHWNSVYFDGLSDDFTKELVDMSYNSVVKGLPKKIRELFKS